MGRYKEATNVQSYHFCERFSLDKNGAFQPTFVTIILLVFNSISIIRMFLECLLVVGLQNCLRLFAKNSQWWLRQNYLGRQNSKNGWVTNNGGGGLLINRGGVDPSANYARVVCNSSSR